MPYRSIRYLSLQGGRMVFLAVSSGSLRCLCSELYRARTFAGWCDPWLPVHPLEIPRFSNNPPTEPENWIFRPSHPDVFRGDFWGCSVSLQKCMVETAAGFCASHLHRINIIFMPSSVEVAKSFVSWLQIWDDWLGVGFLVGAISVSIWSIYLFVIFLVLFIVLFIYLLLNWLIFYLQHTHTSIYILIYFMHNHMTNTHTRIYRPMVILYVRSSSHFLNCLHFEHDLYI